MNDLILRNGLVVSDVGTINGGVRVDAGKIAAIGADSELGSASREIDLNGRVLLPGVIDPHVHFGFGDAVNEDTMVEDFRHNTKDCLVGGVTTVSTTTFPSARPLTELFQQGLRCAHGHSYCDYKFTSVVSSREQADQIPAVVSQGGVSFKFFTGYIGEQAEGFGMDPSGITPDVFLECCEAIRRAGSPAFPKIHAEEPYVRGALIDRLSRESHERDILTAWAESSPEWAESAQIYTYGQVSHQLGLPLYPVHISSAYTVGTIRNLKAQGIGITGETLAYFLCTTAEEMDAKQMGAKGKIQPPVRHEQDRQALWQGIQDGTLSIIGTDSLTYSSKYKEGVDFWDCRVGINLQVADTLPLLWDEGINKGRIDFQKLAGLVSTNVAKRYGLYPKKGAIAPGSDADLVVIDPNKEITLGTARYKGNTDYSLWEGRRVRGAPVMTFLHGDLVMDEGEVVTERPSGGYVEQPMPPRADR